MGARVGYPDTTWPDICFSSKLDNIMSEIEQLTEFTDEHWGILYNYLSTGRVVPVIGSEMLVARAKGKIIPFYQVVAKRLAYSCKMPTNNEESLNDFFTRFRSINMKIGHQNQKMAEILEEMKNEKQSTLQKLVEIKAFRLFITTTPDSLLTKTISDNGMKPVVYDFNPRQKVVDLPSKELNVSEPYVYHLYGRADTGNPYAISEDDHLKFSYEWLKSINACDNLINYLYDKYLLLLGCGYNNWQARFFLIGLKAKNLFSNQDDYNSLLADSCTKCDEPLQNFLSRCGGNIYYKGNATDFIDKLSKYIKKNPIRTLKNKFNINSIFISYAHEDFDSAWEIKQTLEKFNLPVWLDEERLYLGDDIDAIIEENIKNSSLFLAILSKNTVNDPKSRYFRKEWDWAIKNAPSLPADRHFINPIAIDDVTPCSSINPYINNLKWAHAPNGKLDKRDCDRLLKILTKLSVK